MNSMRPPFFAVHNSCEKVMILHPSVILFTGGGGLALGLVGVHPPRQSLPGQTPPPGHGPLGPPGSATD